MSRSSASTRPPGPCSGSSRPSTCRTSRSCSTPATPWCSSPTAFSRPGMTRETSSVTSGSRPCWRPVPAGRRRASPAGSSAPSSITGENGPTTTWPSWFSGPPSDREVPEESFCSGAAGEYFWVTRGPVGPFGQHSRGRNLRTHRRKATVVAVTALSLILSGPALATSAQKVANPQAPEVTGSPADIGQWTQPFEEGGAGTPRCSRTDGHLKDEIFCKVAAVTTAMLPDGRVYYANGIEADENVRYHYVPELGNRTRADRTRVLDLRGPEPQWTIPPQEPGASWNPQVKPGQNWMNGDPFGVIGAPGRPGDGFTGSKWGKLGGPPHQPSSPPDDKPYSERSTFCADIAQLPDGRMLMAGGTDYYNEPSFTDRDEGAPADIGVLELEGLRAPWMFDPKTDQHHATAPMKYGRWYPSLVTLPDGKITVFSGVTKLLKSSQLGQVRRTETFDPATNAWTENYVGDESETALPLFSRLSLMANGKILFNGVGQNFGPNGTDAEEATFNLQKMFDPATKKWEIVGPALMGSRGSASQVMLPIKAPYDKTSILTFGGTIGIPPGAPLATNLSTLTTVTKDGKVDNRMTKGQLNNRRWFHDGTILPDGTILATNGGDKDSLQMPGYEIAVRQAEIYDPA